MTHALRKYLSQRGSALFMVLSLMTALMVLVMAMYFSVVSSREIQYKVFYQEQSYRSATSLADAIVSGLNNDKWTDSGSSDFMETVGAMTKGQTISTNGNEFAAFLGTGNEEVDQLGAYTVDITCLSVDGSEKHFDMAITVSVGGVIDTTHAFFKVNLEKGQPEGPNQTFASTGYAPNDAYVDGGIYNADVYYNNEYTVIGGYSAQNQMSLELNGDLRASGTVTVQYLTPANPIKPRTWLIQNDLHYNAVQGNDLSHGGKNGLLIVGGDFYFNGAPFKGCDIYVLGDMHVMANLGGLDNSVRLFVAGDIIYEPGGNAGLPPVYYCSNLVNRSGTATAWDDSGKDKNGKDAMTSGEVVNRLKAELTPQTFYKWEINSTKPKDDEGKDRADFIPELDTRTGATPNKKTIKFNPSYLPGPDGTPGKTYTVELPWEEHIAEDYFGEDEHLYYNAFVIEDVVMDSPFNAWGMDGFQQGHLTLIIDTGDSPDNQVIIKTLANRDFDLDEDGEKESFCWYPTEDYQKWANNIFMNILIKGKGSVVIDVPENVIYQEMQFQKVMHETWFALLGGTVDTANNIYTLGKIYADATQGFVHDECPPGCTQCGTLTVTENVAKCEKKMLNGDVCGGSITEVTCTRHEYTYSFCTTCESPPKSADDGTYYGICCNRVDRNAVDTKVASLTGTVKSMCYKDGDTSKPENLIYPTVNYFIVSSDESADIRFATVSGPDGSSKYLIENCVFGFVYAPYMTYKAYNPDGSKSGGNMVRFCGGMVVSDYVLEDCYSMINVFPEYLPKQMTSAANRSELALGSASGQEWTVKMTGY